MDQPREQYVKPLLTQLVYSSDVKVTMAFGCKTVGSTNGALNQNCTAEDFSSPCSDPGVS